MALEHLVASTLCGFAKLVTGVRALWHGGPPDERQRIYFANHSSHGDFLLIWASLPLYLRGQTRPVAAADYWLRDPLRRYLAQRVFRSVLIDRTALLREHSPVALMGAALQRGESLIIFPEGTRNLGDGVQPFKSGIYHLASANPAVELVPVWIENLGRAMPKGALLPVPLLCTLRFGPPIRIAGNEGKQEFLKRAQDALLALAPPAD